MTVRTGTNVICIQQVESRRLIRFAIENGRILPLHLGASGKAILAYETERVLDQVLKRMEDPRQKEALLENLERIRRQGYCLTVGEVDPDVFGIAAPIFDGYRRVVASLTIAGPSERLHPGTGEMMIRSVVEATREISRAGQSVRGGHRIGRGDQMISERYMYDLVVKGDVVTPKEIVYDGAVAVKDGNQEDSAGARIPVGGENGRRQGLLYLARCDRCACSLLQFGGRGV